MRVCAHPAARLVPRGVVVSGSGEAFAEVLQLPHIIKPLWEALQVRMYTSSARRLVGHMRRLLRRRSSLAKKMAQDALYYGDGYGHFKTQVLEVDEQLRQTAESIERLAKTVGEQRLVRASEAMQRLVEEAKQIMERVESQPDPSGSADTPTR
jgi:methyl-accepting chemotaxis protein